MLPPSRRPSVAAAGSLDLCARGLLHPSHPPRPCAQACCRCCSTCCGGGSTRRSWKTPAPPWPPSCLTKVGPAPAPAAPAPQHMPPPQQQLAAAATASCAWRGGAATRAAARLVDPCAAPLAPLPSRCRDGVQRGAGPAGERGAPRHPPAGWARRAGGAATPCLPRLARRPAGPATRARAHAAARRADAGAATPAPAA